MGGVPDPHVLVENPGKPRTGQTLTLLRWTIQQLQKNRVSDDVMSSVTKQPFPQKEEMDWREI
jgi:hypothetical protein